MMSDFRGDGGSEMTPKNRTLEGKNRTLGGNGGSKIIKNHKFMDDPLYRVFHLDMTHFKVPNDQLKLTSN